MSSYGKKLIALSLAKKAASAAPKNINTTRAEESSNNVEETVEENDHVPGCSTFSNGATESRSCMVAKVRTNPWLTDYYEETDTDSDLVDSPDEYIPTTEEMDSSEDSDAGDNEIELVDDNGDNNETDLVNGGGKSETDPVNGGGNSETDPVNGGGSSETDPVNGGGRPPTRRNKDGSKRSPRKVKTARRPQPNPTSWKKNERKRKRSLGLPYVNSKKCMVPGKALGVPCKNNCRFQCATKITEDRRREIFECYWQLSSSNRQRDFISSGTVRKLKQQRTVQHQSRRCHTLQFFLDTGTERIKVCRTMFLNTLGIKKGTLNSAMKKRTAANTTEPDKRGGKTGISQIPTEDIKAIETHIKSFPYVLSHYCRKKTSVKYLDPRLNVSEMYRLYKVFCCEKNLIPQKISYYRNIFNTKFKLGFHQPRKDQCFKCRDYDSTNPSRKLEMVEEHNIHLAEKDRARNEKEDDKVKAIQNPTEINSCNYDLQQVLYVPTDPTNSALFYKTKLSTFNLTIFDVAKKTGKCFMWNETEGSKGACEISSCLFAHLKSLPETVNTATFFSDTTGGQNRNQFVSTMFLFAVQALSISLIDQKFLIPGHSQMECDSMHARIERASKNVPVYSPSDWHNIARMAKRTGTPYNVITAKEANFVNWKALAEVIMKNRTKDDVGNIINWHHIKWIRYEKAHPFVMKVKTNIADEEFRRVSVLPVRGRRPTVEAMSSNLTPLYPERRPLPALKVKHLRELCNKRAIPPDYQPFILSLIGGVTETNEEEETTTVPDVNDTQELDYSMET